MKTLTRLLALSVLFFNGCQTMLEIMLIISMSSSATLAEQRAAYTEGYELQSEELRHPVFWRKRALRRAEEEFRLKASGSVYRAFLAGKRDAVIDFRTGRFHPYPRQRYY